MNNSIGHNYRTISIYPFSNNRYTYGVVTIKGSFSKSGKISNFIAVKGVTKDSVAPDKVKNIHQ